MLGPPLWNLFFRDVAQPATSLGGEPSVFADDLNVFKRFDKKYPNEDILHDMQLCRVRVHHWGGINRVAFDPGKEHIVVLHPRDGSGDPFKLLGLMVDVKLLMNQAIEKILSQIRPKIKAILRTKPYYSVKN